MKYFLYQFFLFISIIGSSIKFLYWRWRKVKNSFTKCLESIKYIEKQTDGTYKITYRVVSLLYLYCICLLSSMDISVILSQ